MWGLGRTSSFGCCLKDLVKRPGDIAFMSLAILCSDECCAAIKTLY